MPFVAREQTPLVAYIEDATASEGATREGVDPPGISRDQLLMTPSARAHVQLGTADRFGTAHDVQVVLHGEVYHAASDPVLWVAAQVAERGLGAALDELYGAFVLLVADRGRDVLALVTDRVQARRVLARPAGGGLWCTTGFHPALVAEEGGVLDPVGVAWYLSNGVVYGGGTVYDGVRVLERAHVHTWEGGRLQAEPYWTFRISGTRNSRPEREVAAELGERLMRGAERCLTDAPEVLLSLSGGYDATAIGGLLHALEADPVESFSYLVGEPDVRADEGVAQAIAAALGVQHRLIQGYDGDLLRHIRDNAHWGRGLCNVSDELYAWQTLATDIARMDHPALFAGDECLGWDDVRLRGAEDVLHVVGINGFGGLGWLRSIMPPGDFDVLADGLAAARKRLLTRYPAYEDLHDLKDHLYLDQRLAHLIMPWRQYIAGRLLPVRNPLLDPDVLDAVAALPSRWRRGKALFRRTVAAMFPALFRIPRARRGNYGIALSAEFARHADRIRQHIRAGSSPLDDLVSPDVALVALDAIVRDAGQAPSLRQRVLGAVRERLPRSIKRPIKRYTPPVVDPVSRGVFLRRWLVLREAVALRDTMAGNEPGEVQA